MPIPTMYVFALVQRRAEIFVQRQANGRYELPGTQVAASEDAKMALSRLVREITSNDVSAVGPQIELSSVDTKRLCFPVLTKKSLLETGVAELGMQWISRDICQQQPALCADALSEIMSKLPQDGGNTYVCGETAHGVPTFFHLATGETLHGQVGPWQEAQNLYLEVSGLRTRQGRVVVHDLGLGCGTLALAALDLFSQRAELESMDLLSYDLELNGISSLLANLDKFSFAQPFRQVLEDLLQHQFATFTTRDGRKACWKFIGGDFLETSERPISVAEKGNILFLDFFSPKSHPHLSTYRVMKNIFDHAAEDAVLVTHSSASALKAALAAAGFFVGHAPASGKKACSIKAAKRLSDLDEPLPATWIRTFLVSHAPFSAAETEESRRYIREQLEKHPQFQI